MTSPHSHEEAQERAALYSLGALPPDEAQSFAEHLRGCEECARELASFTAVADDLSLAAASDVPADRVRAAVLEHVAAPVMEQGGLRFVRSGQLDWQSGALPAVERKNLFDDAARGYRTQLVRMAPGASYPPHRHVEAEEIYLIEGDIVVSGVTMHAGDYCRADAGSVHQGVHTRNGCVFIVMKCERDEWLA